MSAPNVFVLVKKSGKPETLNAQLPIYWMKSVAKQTLDQYKAWDLELVSIPAHEIDNLIKKYRK